MAAARRSMKDGSCYSCFTKGCEILALKEKVREYEQLLAKTKSSQHGSSESEERPEASEASKRSSDESEDEDCRVQRKRKRVVYSPESSQDESDEDSLEVLYSHNPVATKNRPKVAGNQKKQAQLAREEKRSAKAAEQEAKALRKAVQALKMKAGPHLKEAMAWKKRCRPFRFSLEASEAIFRALVNGATISTSVHRNWNGTSNKMLTAKLDREEVVRVFGVGRSEQKYRMGSVGTIIGMTLEWGDEVLEIAGTWTLS